MKCEIIGFTHLKGVSKKTNKDYDFYQISATYKPEQGYTGKRVIDVNVDPACVNGIEKLTLPIIAEITKDFATNRTIVCL